MKNAKEIQEKYDELVAMLPEDAAFDIAIYDKDGKKVIGGLRGKGNDLLEVIIQRVATIVVNDAAQEFAINPTSTAEEMTARRLVSIMIRINEKIYEMGRNAMASGKTGAN